MQGSPVLLSLNVPQVTRFGRKLPPTASYVVPTDVGPVSCESLVDARTLLVSDGKALGRVEMNCEVEDKLSGKIIAKLLRHTPQEAYTELLGLAADGSHLVLWCGAVRLAEASATGDVKTMRTWQTSKMNWLSGIWCN